MAEQHLSEINFSALTSRHYTPSPSAWEDQVLYFLLLDRFSDGQEQGFLDNNGQLVATGATSLFQPGDANNAIQSEAEAAQWRAAGNRFVGGTLKGLESKIGYLKRLGITAIWVSPIFKQVPTQQSYHGYGIQDFLEVDSHFGTRQDLRDLVNTAHTHGIYVILDIILNHAGNVFDYDADRYLTWDQEQNRHIIDPRWDDKPYQVKGFRDQNGDPTLPFGPVDLTAHPNAWPDGSIWPAEFQTSETFTQKGRINNWNFEKESLEGDFFGLKDIHHGQGQVDEYQPSETLWNLCEVYKFWIAFADIDGYRIDTVKHMDEGATRFFNSVIKEFTACMGKENFYLIGEITGGRKRAFETLGVTGLDAALGIDDIQDKMEYLVKGQRNPIDYFSLFRNSELVNKDSHIWFRNRVVTMFDDHDQVRKGDNKARFCAGREADKLLLPVLALNLTTLGIPCIYYGSEQLFDGNGGSDRFIREAMFGGKFGAFRSRQRHFFDEGSLIYQETAKIIAIRQSKITLRRGRQYLRQISGNGDEFGFPVMINNQLRSIVAWSRFFNDKEMVLAINTDPDNSLTAWVTVDNRLHQVGNLLPCLYSSEPTQSLPSLTIEPRNGKSVLLTVPAAGFVIYETP